MSDAASASGPEGTGPIPSSWVSDNPKAALAIWELCQGETYYASVIDPASRDALAASGLDSPPPAGSVVCVLQDGQTYFIAPPTARPAMTLRPYVGWASTARWREFGVRVRQGRPDDRRTRLVRCTARGGDVAQAAELLCVRV